MVLRMNRVDKTVKKPYYDTPVSSHFNICSCEDVRLRPGQTTEVSTGLEFEIPDHYLITFKPSRLMMQAELTVIGPLYIDSNTFLRFQIRNESQKDTKLIMKDDVIALGRLERSDQTQFIFNELPTYHDETHNNGDSTPGNI